MIIDLHIKRSLSDRAAATAIATVKYYFVQKNAIALLLIDKAKLQRTWRGWDLFRYRVLATKW